MSLRFVEVTQTRKRAGRCILPSGCLSWHSHFCDSHFCEQLYILKNLRRTHKSRSKLYKQRITSDTFYFWTIAILLCAHVAYFRRPLKNLFRATTRDALVFTYAGKHRCKQYFFKSFLNYFANFPRHRTRHSVNRNTSHILRTTRNIRDFVGMPRTGATTETALSKRGFRQCESKEELYQRI